MRALPLALALFAASVSAFAQEGYRLPPREIVDLVDAPPTPSLSISPDGAWKLEVARDAMPSIADVSRRMLRLAGTRIDPAADARFSTSFDRALTRSPLRGGEAVAIALPEGARISGTGWSHTSTHYAITIATDAGTELWVGSVEDDGRPVLVTDRLSAVLTSGYRWTPDGAGLVLNLVPEDRGAEPPAPTVPTGPNVQETAGDTSPVRTYQDLLASPHDEALFEHYAVSELVRHDLATGEATPLGAPALYRGVDPAPDGEHLLVTTIHRPYYYLHPYRDFPHTVDVWDAAGRVVHRVADVGLPEGVPIGGVRTGPRSIQWRAGAPATLVWVEALDEGDPDVEVPHRDAWSQRPAPFTSEATELLRTEHRARGLTWTADASVVLASDSDRDRRWTRTWMLDLDRPDAEPLFLDDRSQRDRYGDPGRPMTVRDDAGRSVLRQDGPWIYRSGSGSSDDGDRPFLDRFNLDTGQTQRLWRCAEGEYESVSRLVTTGPGRMPAFVTRHEGPTSPPNYRWRDLEDAREFEAITAYPDPQPALRGVSKRLVTYERADGVPLSATLYLPAGYEEGTQLPLFVWAYPREYNDPATAGQVSGSPHRFTTIRGSSHLFLLTQGWAIMDGATMPVIGHPETMNDTFVEQIVAAAQAAIDTAVDLGVADRDRVGVGGHSYGAFMTSNLLAHCDLFRAGVARSGAYNRTLTPFGFQSERRTFWEASDTYFSVSPFMHADHIDEPLLLIHGEADNNSGTFPIQSQRLFQAVKGNGGTARLVMLPAESHGYRARESVLHTLAETVDWLDAHVVRAGAVEASAPR